MNTDKTKEGIKEGLIEPVKKQIPERIESDFYTLDWDGKGWRFSEWDIDDGRAYPSEFNNTSYRMFTEEFRLEESGLTQEQILKMSPQELVLKGNWKACDHYGICSAKTDPSIKVEGFDKKYCGSYQYVQDACSLEHMLNGVVDKIKSIGSRDDPNARGPEQSKKSKENTDEIKIIQFIKGIEELTSLEDKLSALKDIHSLGGSVAEYFVRNLHVSTRCKEEQRCYDDVKTGDYNLCDIVSVESMQIYYSGPGGSMSIIDMEVGEIIVRGDALTLNPNQKYRERKDFKGRSYSDLLKDAVAQLKKDHIARIAKDDMINRTIQGANDANIDIKMISSSPKEEYCLALSVSNRVVPDIEDFFFHVTPSGDVTDRHYCSYPDSQYQEDQPMICPGCKTNFNG